jgi:prolyl oligopeptidase
MKTTWIFLLLCLCMTGTLLAQQAPPTLSRTGVPATPKRPVTDVYFGKAIVDNYRWLEDVNSPEVKDWFKAQGDYTANVLNLLPAKRISTDVL